MLSLRVRFLLTLTLMFATALLRPNTADARRNVECSPCDTVGNDPISHDWTLACCDSGADCFMYPDAQQLGNPGSCPGMHRPCGAS